MILPGMSNIEAGAVAESFVKYKLERWGEIVLRPKVDLPYDLLVMRGDVLIKIQVKSRRKPDYYSYKFSTTHKAKTCAYKEGVFDMMALVALDIEEILFMPHTPQRTLNIQVGEFGEGRDIATWYDMLDTLGIT